jgi:hypothetical protein
MAEWLEADDPWIWIGGIGGNCPVQANGILRLRMTSGGVADYPFYFRSRGTHWQFCVADHPDGDPMDAWPLGGGVPYCGYYREEQYPDGHPNGGWIDSGEARLLIRKAAYLWLFRDLDNPEP